jgi:hypothetical protein
MDATTHFAFASYAGEPKTRTRSEMYTLIRHRIGFWFRSACPEQSRGNFVEDILPNEAVTVEASKRDGKDEKDGGITRGSHDVFGL